jgi:formylglycine-generating enzyme required for sulfatase activity
MWRARSFSSRWRSETATGFAGLHRLMVRLPHRLDSRGGVSVRANRRQCVIDPLTASVIVASAKPPADRQRSLLANMVSIPSGTFLMGSDRHYFAWATR